jgi:hypothetical protein
LLRRLMLFWTRLSYSRRGTSRDFSLWSLPYLVREGIITEDEEVAGYYSMLGSIFADLENDPHSHSGARNILFHRLLADRAIVEYEGRFGVDVLLMRQSTTGLLRELGDIRAEGDTERFEALKGTYLSTERQSEFKTRFSTMPLGVGLIFPRLVEKDCRYTGEVTYPSRFLDQRSVKYYTRKS